MLKPGQIKTVKLYNGKKIIRRIQAWQARNYDGTFAGYKQGTPEGDRWLIEEKFIPKDPTQPIRYTNFWNLNM
jgi:hypothetical protein